MNTSYLEWTLPMTTIICEYSIFNSSLYRALNGIYILISLFSYPIQFIVPIEIIKSYGDDQLPKRRSILAEVCLRVSLVLFTCMWIFLLQYETKFAVNMTGVLSFAHLGGIFEYGWVFRWISQRSSWVQVQDEFKFKQNNKPQVLITWRVGISKQRQNCLCIVNSIESENYSSPFLKSVF